MSMMPLSPGTMPSGGSTGVEGAMTQPGAWEEQGSLLLKNPAVVLCIHKELQFCFCSYKLKS